MNSESADSPKEVSNTRQALLILNPIENVPLIISSVVGMRRVVL